MPRFAVSGAPEEIILSDHEIDLRNYISLKALLERWKGCDRRLLQQIVAEGKLKPLFPDRIRKEPDGSLMCKANLTRLAHAVAGGSLDKSFFSIQDVEQLEREGPTLLYPTLTSDEAARVLDNEPQYNPNQLIERLKSENDKLRTYLEMAKQRIEELQAQLDERMEADSRTKKATNARGENTRHKYIADIAVAVALAVECARDGTPQATSYHESRWKDMLREKGISGTRRDSFRSFRRALPENLKEKDPSRKE